MAKKDVGTETDTNAQDRAVRAIGYLIDKLDSIIDYAKESQDVSSANVQLFKWRRHATEVVSTEIGSGAMFALMKVKDVSPLAEPGPFKPEDDFFNDTKAYHRFLENLKEAVSTEPGLLLPRQEVAHTVSETLRSDPYVAPELIAELHALEQVTFDLKRLLEICEELNTCYRYDCGLAVVMLVRALIDHVPPIFGCRKFSEVANNYSGGTKSFRALMEHLDKSLRNIADAYLHEHVRKQESLPTHAHIDFRADIAVLLQEIVKVLSSPDTNTTP